MIDMGQMQRLVGQSCLALDDLDFEVFLALCAPYFTYRITVWSPELRKTMVWLEHDRAGLETVFESLPQHLQRTGRLARHATVYTCDQTGTSDQIKVVSRFVVHHINLDGQTSVLAVGRYNDVVIRQESGILLQDREVALETRDLGIGLHVPL